MSAARDGADASAVFRRYERRLRAWLAGRVSASPALVEDACASAWLILVAKQPVCGERVFGWLCKTALHEAYRLLRLERREQASELGEEQPAFVPPRRDHPETTLEASERFGRSLHCASVSAATWPGRPGATATARCRSSLAARPTRTSTGT
jgi:DNA-directed RNA polymerase specialized sigma24 family protein